MRYSKLNIILFLIWIISGCGYYSVKGSIPDHIKSIFIHPIENQSSGDDIIEFLNKEIDEQFLEANILKIESYENSDSHLRIKILSLSDKPTDITVGEFQKVEGWEITARVQVVWTDISNNTDIVNITIGGTANYGLGMDISSDSIDNDRDGLIDEEDSDEFGLPREGAMRIISSEISDKIMEKIKTTW